MLWCGLSQNLHLIYCNDCEQQAIKIQATIISHFARWSKQDSSHENDRPRRDNLYIHVCVKGSINTSVCIVVVWMNLTIRAIAFKRVRGRVTGKFSDPSLLHYFFFRRTPPSFIIFFWRIPRPYIFFAGTPLMQLFRLYF